MAPPNRVNLKKILADPELRRKLMVSTIQATQAREGIETTPEQARRAYFVVTEGEKTAFFDLDQFKGNKEKRDTRHDAFVAAVRDGTRGVRFDVSRRDFASVQDSPLAYHRIGLVAAVFREFPTLGTSAEMWQGVITRADEQYLRHFWEVTPAIEMRPWKTIHKGGEFSRFYFDASLMIDWSPSAQEQFHRLRDTTIYFRRGLTWPRRTAKGLNVRRLPAGCVFSDKGPSMFLKDPDMEDYILGVVNSALFEFLFKSRTSFSWEIGIMRTMPVPTPDSTRAPLIGSLASAIYDAKASWDEGNETATTFQTPWILRTTRTKSLSEGLQQTLDLENLENAKVQDRYAELNEEVYQLYGISERRVITESLGERPTEIIWPQMEGKSTDQKRMEHVWRLLSYIVKRIVEADEDGIVPFLHVSGEVPLLHRVHAELAELFPERDVNAVEAEINNELKQRVKGYDRVENIQDWFENVFFSYHTSLYKNRPIFWHIASSQGKKRAAFATLVHYHRFDADRMAKLRATYLRGAIDLFRREAAQALKDGRTSDHLEWQARLEEAQDFDKRLQRVQEGLHQGGEDFRILTPWKTEAERPKGWNPDINDGVKVNIEPLQRAGLLRIPEVV